jgi:hypothetical protein
MGEVELGGLEEEGNGPAFGPADDEYHLFDRDEVRIYIYSIFDVIRPCLL